MTNKPIGVFDSGLGGLTVVKELIKQLPQENIVYFGDTARVPYGTKSEDTIIRFSLENSRTLLKRQVKMIVVACNSSSSYAIRTLKKNFDIPVVGVIFPGAQKAVASSKTNRIGVIATSATTHSQQYTKIIKELSPSAKVFTQACPLFVPLVEEGWLSNQVTLDIVKKYVSPLKKSKIDTLILGCTHYPLLKGVLKKAMGPKVTLVDSAREIAARVKYKLTQLEMINSSKRKVKRDFIVSDRPMEFERIAKKFLGFSIKVKVEAGDV